MSSLHPTNFAMQFLMLLAFAFSISNGSYGIAAFIGGLLFLDVCDEIVRAIKSRTAIAAAGGE